MYIGVVAAAVFVLIFRFVKSHGQKNMMVYIGICSLTGSITVYYSNAGCLFMTIYIYTIDQHKLCLNNCLHACIGYGSESSRNCFEADIRRVESVYVL